MALTPQQQAIPHPCGPDWPPVLLTSALTDEQIREFSLNPWSIFEKIPGACKFLPSEPKSC